MRTRSISGRPKIGSIEHNPRLVKQCSELDQGRPELGKESSSWVDPTMTRSTDVHRRSFDRRLHYKHQDLLVARDYGFDSVGDVQA